MDSDKYTDLPDWDEEHFPEEGGADWQPNETREACRALFTKWQEVVFLLNGVISSFSDCGEEDDPEMLADLARDLLSDAFVVGEKIKSSEAGGTYVIRMENAAIIRKLGQGIASSLLLFTGEADEKHIKVVRKEIDTFRLMFIEWVSTFKKDEYTDDWGLFI